MPIIYILIALFFCNNLVAGDKNHGDNILSDISSPTQFIQQAFDVQHYDAEINLSAPPSTVMSGKCAISLNWLENPTENKFYFHLRDLTIDSVFYLDTKVTPVEVGNDSSATYHWEITPPANYSQTSATITVYYHGSMTGESWGGVETDSSDKIVYVLGAGMYSNSVSMAEHWLPCYDHPSDKATLHCKFTVPSSWVVASNGTVNVQYINNGTDVYEWTHNYQCATYLYTFAIGKYIKYDYDYNGLPIVAYTLLEDTANSNFVYKHVPNMLKAFEYYYCPYPYEKVGFVNTVEGSMEHQTMISMAISVIQLTGARKDTMASVVAHELSHHWFGDLVTPLDFREAWLSEGFATFSESIYYEYYQGFTAYLNYQSNMINKYISTISLDEGILPLYNFSRVAPSSNYPTTIYYKGAAVNGMLRYAIGDSAFFQGLRSYLNKYKYSNVTTKDFKQVMDSVSGQNLDWFFKQWVYGKGYPIIKVNIYKKLYSDSLHCKSYIKITQTQDTTTYCAYTNLPIEIGFYKTDGTFYYQVLNMDSTNQTFILDSIDNFTKITVNKGPSLRSLLKTTSTSITIIDNDLSVNYENNDYYLYAYPNPAQESVSLQFNAIQGDTQIIVNNIYGEEIFKDKLYISDNNANYKLNTSSYANGIYIISIIHNNSKQVLKLVVNK